MTLPTKQTVFLRTILAGLCLPVAILFVGCSGEGGDSTLPPISTMPATINEQEGSVTAVWTLISGSPLEPATYSGTASNGDLEVLTVKSWQSGANGVVIARTDRTGPSAGLTATYTGTFGTGNTAAGSVVWTPATQSASPTWSASW